jgi:hypothetical protein
VTKIILPRPPQTDEELWWCIKAFFGVEIPRVSVCAEHVSPFHAVAHAFFSKAPNYAVWYASRGSGKSLALAVLGLVKAFFTEVDVTIIGGSMVQSLNVRNHMAELLSHENAPSWAVDKDLATLITTSSGAKIEPLPASQKTVRGKHPVLQLLDEVDEMELDIYDSSLGQAMPQKTRNRLLAAAAPDEREIEYVVASSTWQNPLGSFTEVIDRARKNNMPIFSWCWRELIKTPDNTSGWMTQRFIEAKKKTVSTQMWRTEYELNEPSGESRAFDLDQLEKVFVPYPRPIRQHHEGEDYHSWTWEDPQPTASYVVGADWAKEKDYTVIPVARRDVFPYRLVKLIRINRRPYPFMIELFNKAVQDYSALGEHDKTGLGNVVNDLVDFSDSVRGFDMIGRNRTKLLTDYITDVEHLHYRLPTDEVEGEFDTEGNPIRLEGLEWLKKSHRGATVADVFAPAKWDDHLPDDVAAMALLHRALKRFAAPITEETEIPRDDRIRKVDEQFHTKPYGDGVIKLDGGVTVLDELVESGAYELTVPGRDQGTGLWSPSD